MIFPNKKSITEVMDFSCQNAYKHPRMASFTF